MHRPRAGRRRGWRRRRRRRARPTPWQPLARASMSETTPVEVSEWVRNTAFAPPSSARRAATSLGVRRLAPLVCDRLDLAAVRLGELLPALAEVPRRDDDHPIARRAEVRDRRLHGARSRAGEEQDVGGLEHRAQPLEAAPEDLAVVGAPVVDDRLGECRQHLGGHGRRPGGEQVPLAGHGLSLAPAGPGEGSVEDGRAPCFGIPKLGRVLRQMEGSNGAVVVANEVARRYGEGDTAVDALRGSPSTWSGGQLTTVMGPSGLGQVDAHAHPRRARPADRRQRRDRRHRDHDARRHRADEAAPPAHRLHLPVLQPAADAHGRGEHHAAADHRGREDRPGVARAAAREGRARRIAGSTGRRSSRAASSSGSRSRVR